MVKQCFGCRICPISSSAPRPLGAAFVSILLSEIEQEQRPSRNGDRAVIVVGAGLCDGEGERAYIEYAPHYIFALKKSVFADVDNCLAHFAEFRCPLCRIPMPTLPKKKFGKMGNVGTLCRIRQNGFRQTVPYSIRGLTLILDPVPSPYFHPPLFM